VVGETIAWISAVGWSGAAVDRRIDRLQVIERRDAFAIGYQD
jgi:hypothetical protein